MMQQVGCLRIFLLERTNENYPNATPFFDSAWLFGTPFCQTYPKEGCNKIVPLTTCCFGSTFKIISKKGFTLQIPQRPMKTRTPTNFAKCVVTHNPTNDKLAFTCLDRVPKNIILAFL